MDFKDFTDSIKNIHETLSTYDFKPLSVKQREALKNRFGFGISRTFQIDEYNEALYIHNAILSNLNHYAGFEYLDNNCYLIQYNNYTIIENDGQERLKDFFDLLLGNDE